MEKNNPHSPWEGDGDLLWESFTCYDSPYPPGNDHISPTFWHFWVDDFTNFPFGGILLVTGMVVFEGKISHEDHFNRVSFGWAKPGWPLDFAEMYEGNLHFSSSSSCKTVQTKTPYPPRSQITGGCGRCPAGFLGSKGCQFIHMHR